MADTTGPGGPSPRAAGAQDVTAALRRLYPGAAIRARPAPGGSVMAALPPDVARYLGVGRDDALAAAWISVYAPYPVAVAGRDLADGGVQVTVARAAARPSDPRTSAGVPRYATPQQVTGGFPANRVVTGLIRLAIEAGCRPHIGPQRSPHGRRYRVCLWNDDPGMLHGVIDVMEGSGRYADAWYSWGRGDERRAAGPDEIRRQLTSARDLRRPAAPQRRTRAADPAVSARRRSR